LQIRRRKKEKFEANDERLIFVNNYEMHFEVEKGEQRKRGATSCMLRFSWENY